MKLLGALAAGALMLAGGVATPALAEVKAPLRVLISNDDGVASEGIAALVAALRPFADVTVSAPAVNNSGGSQSVTLFNGPVRVEKRDTGDGVPHYAVSGTPADSVIFGLLEAGRAKAFDLVISGINKGENVGEAVHVSGTVGAARQALMLGVPSIAVSQQYAPDGKYDFTVAARYTAKLVQALQAMGDKAPRFVSVNVPTVAKGVRLTPAGGMPFTVKGFAKVGEDGPATIYRADFGMGGNAPKGSDTEALANGYITVTPLTADANARLLDAKTAKKLVAIGLQ